MQRFWKRGELTFRLNKPCLCSLWCIPANSIYINNTFIFYYVRYLYIWTCISYNPSKYYVPKASASGGHRPPDPLPGLCPSTPLGDRLPSPEPPDWPVFILGLSGGISPKNSEISPQNRRDRRTRGTNSWLDGKTLVPIFLYCLNCTKYRQLILGKITKIAATRCQILRLKCTK